MFSTLHRIGPVEVVYKIQGLVGVAAETKIIGDRQARPGLQPGVPGEPGPDIGGLDAGQSPPKESVCQVVEIIVFPSTAPRGLAAADAIESLLTILPSHIQAVFERGFGVCTRGGNCYASPAQHCTHARAISQIYR